MDGFGCDSVKSCVTLPASPESLYLYSSDRISHYKGSGLLVLTPRGFQLEEMFVEDKEMVFFSTPEELLEKVVYFKTHDDQRRQVARAGWEKIHHCYNERLVAQYMLERIFQLELTESYAWQTQIY